MTEDILSKILKTKQEVKAYPDNTLFAPDFQLKLAMDEYAQQEAIAFAEWILKEDWKPTVSLWYPHKGGTFITTEQLYNLYQQNTQP